MPYHQKMGNITTNTRDRTDFKLLKNFTRPLNMDRKADNLTRKWVTKLLTCYQKINQTSNYWRTKIKH